MDEHKKSSVAAMSAEKRFNCTRSVRRSVRVLRFSGLYSKRQQVEELRMKKNTGAAKMCPQEKVLLVLNTLAQVEVQSSHPDFHVRKSKSTFFCLMQSLKGGRLLI